MSNTPLSPSAVPPSPNRPVRIGTRASRLAKWQAEHVRAKLAKSHPARTFDIIELTTTGDSDATTPLTRFSGTGIFVAELERALLDGRIDLAVHSLKDLPTTQPDALTVLAIGERADPREAFVAREADSFDSLPHGAIVGTSSIRRASQLKALRPDLDIRNIRGNVETRIKKVDAGDFDATVLALAGLTRLGLESRATEIFELEDFLPAPAQGVLGLEWRTADSAWMLGLVAPLRNALVEAAVLAERTLLKELEAGCHAPVAAIATFDGNWNPASLADHSPDATTDAVPDVPMTLAGFVGTGDGRQTCFVELDGTSADAAALGRALAENILDAGGRRIMAKVAAARDATEAATAQPPPPSDD